MKLNINQSSTGAWFPLFGSKLEDDGKTTWLSAEDPAQRVYVNPPLSAESLEKIYAETRTKKSEFVKDKDTRQMVRVVYYDQNPAQARREFEMIFCEIIGDFELTDEAGAKIPVTPENKIKLMKNAEFARFVGRCMQLLEMSEVDRKAALEKN